MDRRETNEMDARSAVCGLLKSSSSMGVLGRAAPNPIDNEEEAGPLAIAIEARASVR